MKLRNKKTGKVYDLECITVFDRPGKNDIGDSIDEFYTIAGLTEEWEDYTPAEPLIKDEKIRNIIKEWAEKNGDKKVRYDLSTNEFYKNDDKGYDIRSIKFKFEYRDAIGLDSGKYTITELCGEEIADETKE